MLKELIPKQLETHNSKLSTVLKHQAISSNSADLVFIVVYEFQAKISPFNQTNLKIELCLKWMGSVILGFKS